MLKYEADTPRVRQGAIVHGRLVVVSKKTRPRLRAAIFLEEPIITLTGMAEIEGPTSETHLRGVEVGQRPT